MGTGLQLSCMCILTLSRVHDIDIITKYLRIVNFMGRFVNQAPQKGFVANTIIMPIN